MHHTLIISYLFLGGAGAGALAVLSVLDMLSWQATVPGGGNATMRSAFYSPQAGYRDFFAPCYLISFISLALGTLCLLFDLGRADRALFLFVHPTLTYVSVGTYALALCLLTAFVMCLIWGVKLKSKRRWMVRLTQSIGLVAAVYLMLYTGLLFRDIGAGTITGSPLLPLLFLVSALSTGVALLLVPLVFGRVGVHFHRIYTRLLRIDTIFIVLEAALLATLFLLASFEPRQAEQVAILLQGDYANMFWIGVVFCGLSAPAILENLSGKIIGLQMRAIPVSVMVLVGGFCLRASIIGVGVWAT